MIEVLISDKLAGGFDNNAAYFFKIDQWAKKHCPGYIGCHVQDVSDHSLEFDEIAAYMFEDERGANWFRLKWL